MHHASPGRPVDLEEFSERAQAALHGRVHADLARITDDLPKSFVVAAGSHRKPARFTMALFGHVARRGRLRLRRQSVAASGFGDLASDLRDVTIDHWQTTVTVLAAFGNVDVYVPEGVQCRRRRISFLGHRRDGEATLTAPTPQPSKFVLSALPGRSTSGACRRTCVAPITVLRPKSAGHNWFRSEAAATHDQRLQLVNYR
jgi:hypothetical protein